MYIKELIFKGSHSDMEATASQTWYLMSDLISDCTIPFMPFMRALVGFDLI
jgi:hypothetical protein